MACVATPAAGGFAGTAARTRETDFTASNAAMMAIVSGSSRGVNTRSFISARHPQRLQKVAFRLASDPSFDAGYPGGERIGGLRRGGLGFAE